MEAPVGTVMNKNPEQVLNFKVLIMTNETSLGLLNSFKDSKESITRKLSKIQSTGKLILVLQREILSNFLVSKSPCLMHILAIYMYVPSTVKAY
jgi:hypothetical protein